MGDWGPRKDREGGRRREKGRREIARERGGRREAEKIQTDKNRHQTIVRDREDKRLVEGGLLGGEGRRDVAAVGVSEGGESMVVQPCK